MSVPKAPGSRVKSLIFFEEARSGEYAYGRCLEVCGDLILSKKSFDFLRVDDRRLDIASPTSMFGIGTSLTTIADGRIKRKYV
jgi:hypothetical protein